MMRALVFKYRGLIWGIFAVAVLLSPASFDPLRTALAVPLLVTGQALRFWAAGLIPKYRTLTLDAPRLVTEGPYSLTRNPLYLGNALMGCGWAAALGWVWLAAFAAAFIGVYSLVIIPYEEQFLRSRFGAEYEDFLRRVPQFFPSFKNYRASDGFDRVRSWSMERHSLRMNIVVTVLVAARLIYEVMYR